MWAAFDFSSAGGRKEWHNLCLERARDSPLQVVVRLIGSTRLESECMPRIAELIGRTAILAICMSGTFQLAQRQAVLNKPMPVLREMHLQMTQLFLPPKLLGGSSATLKHLTLTRVVFVDGSAAPELPVLRSLVLRIASLDRRGSHFTLFLRQAPGLERIELMPPAHKHTLADLEPKVQLARLRVAIIRGPYKGVSVLIRLLPLPSESLYVKSINDAWHEVDDQDVEADLAATGEPKIEVDSVVCDYVLRF
jgi:hypothetical protein